MILLGSTGSIGVNALAIAARFNLEVEALVAGPKNRAILGLMRLNFLSVWCKAV